MTDTKRAQEAYHVLPQCNYQVFLSFRGVDTRTTFTDHLYAALVEAGIHTFKDDDEIERGENMIVDIQKAIQESEISVIIFSKDFASSRWCLNELVRIMEKRKTIGHAVLPIFYDVEPSQVRKQTNSYAESFSRHAHRFKEEMDRVEKWRVALREVADLAGMSLNKRHESQFIQDIVKEVRKKLHRQLLNVSPHLVGIDSRARDINLWLQDESNNTPIATIYGIGGIGKTTIAKSVYNLNIGRFQGHSFLANVSHVSKETNGLVHLQNQLLSDLLKGRMTKVYNEDEGIIKIKDIIRFKKVLIVVDGVNHLDHLDAIIGRREWLFPGSKIIVTTRHVCLLKHYEVCETFEIQGLNDTESLQLFSWHAFGQDHPVDSFMECSRMAIKKCAGLPLALEVFGSSLSGKSINVWENALQKLEAIRDSKIQNVLKVSFDSLPDDHDKNLFLDIACFFIGKDTKYIVGVLDSCGFYTTVGIQNLIDRCLLNVGRKNKITMHQLLRDMGREIVCQESTDEPGRRSRIWHPRDSFTVLKAETGTETIRGLALDMHQLMEDEHGKTTVCRNNAKVQYQKILPEKSVIESCWNQPCCSFFSGHQMSTASANSFSMSNDRYLETKAFKKMHKLKLLQLNYVKLRQKPQYFPKNLRWLCWHGCPLKSLPSNLSFEMLVALDMRYSSLKHIWGRAIFLPELKFLNLGHCHGLIRTPSFSGLPKLERLIFKDCIHLIKVDESIGNLERLVLLNFKGCKNLRELPKTITKLKSLEHLNLSGCLKLNEMPSFKVLNANGFKNQLLSSNLSWHSTFRCWLSPRIVRCFPSFSLASLPHSISDLCLQNCKLYDDVIPTIISNLPFLHILDLGGNPLRSLPESINSLFNLHFLYLNDCTDLQLIPELPADMIHLSVINCASLERLSCPPKSLHDLGCNKLVEVQGFFKTEPISNINIAVAKSWSLPHLETFTSTEADLYNTNTLTRQKIPLQVLYECGIVSVFIPGSEIPSCFSLHSNESKLSIEVPSPVSHKILALNLCVLYTLSQEPIEILISPVYAKISNKTKQMRWMYGPVCSVIPDAQKKEMLWLSQWKLGDEIEIGDQIDVSVISGTCFEVIKWGIGFVYEPEDDDERTTESDTEKNDLKTLFPWFDTVIHNKGTASACFQCHHSFQVWLLNLMKLTENITELEDFLKRKCPQRLQSCVVCDDGDACKTELNVSTLKNRTSVEYLLRRVHK